MSATSDSLESLMNPYLDPGSCWQSDVMLPKVG
ncbi:uncharacterized protein CLUP02_00017 [Colletotrichum lupini]|uniref:Uncharacterized protein n=1 Tax=Colletotrichum lupini TaxID=145971 RepID=A0A9Q8W641_9PEZI|nr:uncharacterized protein CLUP02_00017 [Colletotrichum lupini]UQC73373.1 hypothetical protein CLUP02_00017 [Colletotrichum lupini]